MRPEKNSRRFIVYLVLKINAGPAPLRIQYVRLQLASHALGLHLVDKAPDAHTVHRATTLFALAQFGVQPKNPKLGAVVVSASSAVRKAPACTK
jgi:hypothetical protein